MSQQSDRNLQSLKDFIQAEVRAAWARGEGILLARLGGTILKNGFETKALLDGKKLSAFIEEEMPNEVQIISSPTNKIERIALPREAGEINDVQRLFPRHRAIEHSLDVSTIRGSVVSAFSRPIKEGFSRILKTEPIVEYVDIPVGTDAPKGGWLIPADHILTTNVGKFGGQALVMKIYEWAEKNGIPKEHIEFSGPPLHRVHEAAPSSSLMHKILDALPEAQLKRIELPLDVVAALLKHR